MARLLGVEISDKRILKLALTDIYGIGRKTALDIIDALSLDPISKIGDLTAEQLDTVRNYIDENFKTEGELKQVKFRNIKRLKDIRSYRGIRHRVGLPVRGQRTKTNARTRKGKSFAVGGLKLKITKK